MKAAWDDLTWEVPRCFVPCNGGPVSVTMASRPGGVKRAAPAPAGGGSGGDVPLGGGGGESRVRAKVTRAPATRERGMPRTRTVSPTTFYGRQRHDDKGEEAAEEDGSRSRRMPTAGRTASEWQRRLAALAKPVVFPVEDGRSASLPFTTYPRQEHAFSAADGAGAEGLPVFAFQREENGRRQYFCASYRDFWPRYYAMNPAHRHVYEVVRQARPCHLYFDLEFRTSCNEEADGPAMVDKLIAIVCRELHRRYSLTCTRACVLELDSSTKAKFSRHLIFHLPGAVFADNISMGNFVRTLPGLFGDDGVGAEPHAGNGASSALRPEPIPASRPSTDGVATACPRVAGPTLCVLDKHGATTSFVDTGVYTRNRNFRLYLARKLGKTATLMVASSNTFPLPDPARSMAEYDRQAFLACLLCRMPGLSAGPLRLLECEEQPGSGESQRQSRGLGRTGAMHGLGGPAPAVAPVGAGSGGRGGSPYPDVDRFITVRCSRGGVQGRIRRWALFPDAGVVTYDIADNRYCENVGRQHKSNGWWCPLMIFAPATSLRCNLSPFPPLFAISRLHMALAAAWRRAQQGSCTWSTSAWACSTKSATILTAGGPGTALPSVSCPRSWSRSGGSEHACRLSKRSRVPWRARRRRKKAMTAGWTKWTASLQMVTSPASCKRLASWWPTGSYSSPATKRPADTNTPPCQRVQRCIRRADRALVRVLEMCIGARDGTVSRRHGNLPQRADGPRQAWRSSYCRRSAAPRPVAKLDEKLALRTSPIGELRLAWL